MPRVVNEKSHPSPGERNDRGKYTLEAVLAGVPTWLKEHSEAWAAFERLVRRGCDPVRLCFRLHDAWRLRHEPGLPRRNVELVRLSLLNTVDGLKRLIGPRGAENLWREVDVFLIDTLLEITDELIPQLDEAIESRWMDRRTAAGRGDRELLRGLLEQVREETGQANYQLVADLLNTILPPARGEYHSADSLKRWRQRHKRPQKARTSTELDPDLTRAFCMKFDVPLPKRPSKTEPARYPGATPNAERLRNDPEALS